MTIEITGDAATLYRIKPEDKRIIEYKEGAGGRWRYYGEYKTAAHAKTALLAITQPPSSREDVVVVPENKQESIVSLIYDYGKVDSAVREIVEAAAVEIKLRERRLTEDMIAIGKNLLAVKELLPYGQFSEWVDTEFSYSQTTARDFMHIAQRFDPRTSKFDVLSSSAMRILAYPSVSDEAIDAVIEAGQKRGKPLPFKEVLAIRDRYRGRVPMSDYEWTDSERERLIAVKRGHTVLANLQHDHALIAWAQSQEIFERIDRATMWGNPFVVDEDGSREECILKYEDYYFMKSSLWPKLESLRGKVLGCWCYPEDCHGQVLINFLNFNAENPFEALGFGYPIGSADDYERFTEMHATWAALHYLEEHG